MGLFEPGAAASRPAVGRIGSIAPKMIMAKFASVVLGCVWPLNGRLPDRLSIRPFMSENCSGTRKWHPALSAFRRDN